MIKFPAGFDKNAPENADIVKRTEQFFNIRAKDSELLALVQQGICLEARDEDGRTALIHAAANGKDSTVRALIAAGADIEARDNVGMTVLIYAAWNGKDSIVRQLIAAGADIEAGDNSGFTAPMYAALYSRDDSTTLLLIDYGANVYARNKDNQRLVDLFISNLVGEGKAAYAAFVETQKPPQTKQKMYQLLAFTPLVDEYAPVDYVGNLRKLCVNANWKDKEQAGALLEELQADGVINASNVSDILQQTFPHTNRLLTSRSGGRGK